MKEIKRRIKAWAVLKNGKLKHYDNSQWTLPIMLDKEDALGYAAFQKTEKVVPCEIILKSPHKKVGKIK